jgi:hypothetical protein
VEVKILSYGITIEYGIRNRGIISSKAVWLRKILNHLGYPQLATHIGEDNQGAIKWTAGDNRGGRLQHIDIKCFFIREKVMEEDIKIIYVPSMDNPADILTKPLTGSNFNRHRQTLGVMVDTEGAAYSHIVGLKIKAGCKKPYVQSMSEIY